MPLAAFVSCNSKLGRILQLNLQASIDEAATFADKMTPEEAATIAEEAFAKLNEGKSMPAGPIKVLREATRPVPCGYAVFVNTDRYLRTKERKFAAVGAGPVVVDRVRKQIVMLPTSLSEDEALRRYFRGEPIGVLIGAL